MSKIQFILCEILDSEETYVSDLQHFRATWAIPLRDAASNCKASKGLEACGAEIWTSLVTNLDRILECNSSLLRTMKADMAPHDRSPSPAAVAEAFVSHADALSDVYAPYIKSSKTYGSAFDVAESKGPYAKRVAKIFRAAAVHPASAGRSFADLMILPVQRVPRYEMLLSQLHKDLPSSHPAAAQLVTANDRLVLAVESLNESMFEAECHEKFTRFARTVLDPPAALSPLLSSQGRFLLRKAIVSLSSADAADLLRRSETDGSEPLPRSGPDASGPADGSAVSPSTRGRSKSSSEPRPGRDSDRNDTEDGSSSVFYLYLVNDALILARAATGEESRVKGLYGLLRRAVTGGGSNDKKMQESRKIVVWRPLLSLRIAFDASDACITVADAAAQTPGFPSTSVFFRASLLGASPKEFNAWVTDIDACCSKLSDPARAGEAGLRGRARSIVPRSVSRRRNAASSSPSGNTADGTNSLAPARVAVRSEPARRSPVSFSPGLANGGSKIDDSDRSSGESTGSDGNSAPASSSSSVAGAPSTSTHHSPSDGKLQAPVSRMRARTVASRTPQSSAAAGAGGANRGAAETAAASMPLAALKAAGRFITVWLMGRDERAAMNDAVALEHLFLYYARKGYPRRALALLDKLEASETSPLTGRMFACCVSGFSRIGELEDAEKVFRRALARLDMASDTGMNEGELLYSVWLNALGHAGRLASAKAALVDMEAAGLLVRTRHLDFVTMAAGHAGDVASIDECALRLRELGLQRTTNSVDTLIVAYARAGDLDRSRLVFDAMIAYDALRPGAVDRASRRPSSHQLSQLQRRAASLGISEELQSLAAIHGVTVEGDSLASGSVMSPSAVQPLLSRSTFDAMIWASGHGNKLTEATRLFDQLRKLDRSLRRSVASGKRADMRPSALIQVGITDLLRSEGVHADPSAASSFDEALLDSFECCTSWVSSNSAVTGGPAVSGRSGRRLRRSLVPIDSSSEALLGQSDFKPAPSTFNALIYAYGQAKKPEAAVSLLETMEKLGVKPSPRTYYELLHSFAMSGRADQADGVLKAIRDMEGSDSGHSSLGRQTSFPGQRGTVARRRSVFEDVVNDFSHANLKTFNTMLQSHASDGNTDVVKSIAVAMKRSKVMPNGTTFAALLDAFEVADNLEEGLQCAKTLAHSNDKSLDCTWMLARGALGCRVAQAQIRAGNLADAEKTILAVDGSYTPPDPLQRAYTELASAFVEMGELDKAASVLDSMRASDNLQRVAKKAAPKMLSVVGSALALKRSTDAASPDSQKPAAPMEVPVAVSEESSLELEATYSSLMTAYGLRGRVMAARATFDTIRAIRRSRRQTLLDEQQAQVEALPQTLDTLIDEGDEAETDESDSDRESVMRGELDDDDAEATAPAGGKGDAAASGSSGGKAKRRSSSDADPFSAISLPDVDKEDIMSKVKSDLASDVDTYNDLAEAYLDSGRLDLLDDVLSEMTTEGIAPNGKTLSVFVTGYSRAGRGKETKQVVSRLRQAMVASGMSAMEIEDLETSPSVVAAILCAAANDGMIRTVVDVWTTAVRVRASNPAAADEHGDQVAGDEEDSDEDSGQWPKSVQHHLFGLYMSCLASAALRRSDHDLRLEAFEAAQNALAHFGRSTSLGYDAACGLALLLAAVGRTDECNQILDSIVDVLKEPAPTSPHSSLGHPALSVDVVSLVCTALASVGRDADMTALTEHAEHTASTSIASSAVQARGLHSALEHAAATADAAHALYGAFACSGNLTRAERMWSSPLPATLSRADALLALAADKLHAESPGSAPTSPQLPSSVPGLSLPPAAQLRPARASNPAGSVAPSMMSSSGSTLRPGAAGRRFTRRPRSSLVAPTFDPDTASGIRERKALSGLDELNEVLPVSALSVSSRSSQPTSQAPQVPSRAVSASQPGDSLASNPMTATTPTAQSGQTSLACSVRVASMCDLGFLQQAVSSFLTGPLEPHCQFTPLPETVFVLIRTIAATIKSSMLRQATPGQRPTCSMMDDALREQSAAVLKAAISAGIAPVAALVGPVAEVYLVSGYVASAIKLIARYPLPAAAERVLACMVEMHYLEQKEVDQVVAAFVKLAISLTPAGRASLQALAARFPSSGSISEYLKRVLVLPISDGLTEVCVQFHEPAPGSRSTPMSCASPSVPLMLIRWRLLGLSQALTAAEVRGADWLHHRTTAGSSCVTETIRSALFQALFPEKIPIMSDEELPHPPSVGTLSPCPPASPQPADAPGSLASLPDGALPVGTSQATIAPATVRGSPPLAIEKPRPSSPEPSSSSPLSASSAACAPQPAGGQHGAGSPSSSLDSPTRAHSGPPDSRAHSGPPDSPGSPATSLAPVSASADAPDGKVPVYLDSIPVDFDVFEGSDPTESAPRYRTPRQLPVDTPSKHVGVRWMADALQYGVETQPVPLSELSSAPASSSKGAVSERSPTAGAGGGMGQNATRLAPLSAPPISSSETGARLNAVALESQLVNLHAACHRVYSKLDRTEAVLQDYHVFRCGVAEIEAESDGDFSLAPSHLPDHDESATLWKAALRDALAYYHSLEASMSYELRGFTKARDLFQHYSSSVRAMNATEQELCRTIARVDADAETLEDGFLSNPATLRAWANAQAPGADDALSAQAAREIRRARESSWQELAKQLGHMESTVEALQQVGRKSLAGVKSMRSVVAEVETTLESLEAEIVETASLARACVTGAKKVGSTARHRMKQHQELKSIVGSLLSKRKEEVELLRRAHGAAVVDVSDIAEYGGARVYEDATWAAEVANMVRQIKAEEADLGSRLQAVQAEVTTKLSQVREAAAADIERTTQRLKGQDEQAALEARERRSALEASLAGYHQLLAETEAEASSELAGPLSAADEIWVGDDLRDECWQLLEVLDVATVDEFLSDCMDSAPMPPSDADRLLAAYSDVVRPGRRGFDSFSKPRQRGHASASPVDSDPDGPAAGMPPPAGLAESKAGSGGRASMLTYFAAPARLKHIRGAKSTRTRTTRKAHS